ncbi:MAG TPA: hypothetical protein VIL97_08500 [Thermoanaerobaculia bacterium]
MRALAVAALLLAACQQTPQTAPVREVRTIENTPVRTGPVEPLPMIDDQDALPRPKIDHSQQAKGGAPEPYDDELQKKMGLPFAPAIAMDPVDGSKVSIRPNTPAAEHKNRLFYFSSASNRAAFLAQPQKYLTGELAKY